MKTRKVVVTGAGGFVGRALTGLLEDAFEVVATDVRLEGRPGIEGDLGDPDVLRRVFADGCDAVVHLATVPGGAAEADPAQAKRVNLDAGMAVLDAAAAAGAQPRFVFASSIAVFGDAMPDLVDDGTPTAPRLLYGAHKAMFEQWVAAQTARGAISGLSVRLPGIVARPRGAAGMKSAFLSDLFHAAIARSGIELPVSPGATMWLLSVAQLARNLRHALEIEATGTLNLPALRVAMRDLVEEVGLATGAPPDFVRYVPDPELEAGFGRQPRLVTPRADALGFAHDRDLRSLVSTVLIDIASAR